VTEELTSHFQTSARKAVPAPFESSTYRLFCFTDLKELALGVDAQSPLRLNSLRFASLRVAIALVGRGKPPHYGACVREASPTAGKESRTPERYPGRGNQLFRRPVRAEDPDSSPDDHSLFREFLKNRFHFIVVCHGIPQSLGVSPSLGARAQDMQESPKTPRPCSGFLYFAAM
jgi:hypothetical protein